MVTLGIALLVAGAGLLIAEAHLPTYGGLGITGVVALVAGTLLAIDGAGGGFALALAVAVAIGVVAGTMLLYAVRAGLRVNRRRARTGVESLVGQVGVVRSAPAPLAQVFVDGALWRARPCPTEDEPEALHEGDQVVVERVQGLTLSVRPAETWELEP